MCELTGEEAVIFSIGSFLSFATLFKKNSKVIACIFLLYLWIVFGFNTYNGDYLVYELQYNHPELMEVGGKSFLYRKLIEFSSQHGLDFMQFRAVISLIGLLFISSVVFKYTKYASFVFLCYFLSTFFIDVTQFRSFFASSIVIFAFHFMFEEGRPAVVKYVLCCSVASLIHPLCAVYLIFMLCRYFDLDKIRKIVVFVLCFSFVLYPLGIIKKIAVLFMDESKSSYYFSGTFRMGGIIAWFFIIAAILLFAFLRNELNRADVSEMKESDENNKSAFQKEFVVCIEKITWLLLPLLPLLLYDVSSCFRIYRCMLPLIFTALTVYCFEMNIQKNQKNMFSALIFSYALAIGFEITQMHSVENYLMSAIHDNYLLGG